MKKFSIISVLVFLVLPFYISAKSISINEAEKTARNFYFEKSHVKQNEIIFENIISYKINEDIVFYIFDVEGNKGYVMISADDGYYPVIAYSVSSQFSLNNLPENIKGLYDEFGMRIIYVKNNKLAGTSEIKKLWQKYNQSYKEFSFEKNSKSILLTTANWNQSGAYDDWVPFNEAGTPPTGCVATAMGIVMKYWDFPLQGTGSTSYYESPYGTLNANFGNSHYFWNLMENNSANTFVAHLLFHCGVAVHMNYALEGSGAYVYYGSNSAYNALKNYFQYSPSLVFRYKSDYTDTQWKTYLTTEIDAGRVMLYRGSSVDGGHAWVCDGYDDSDLFHYNFGWGGYNNGYFNIANVGGFTDDNGAIMNIFPNITETLQNPPVNLNSELDTVDLSGFHVNLEWETPVNKAVSSYKIYRIDYDLVGFNHIYQEIADVSSSVLSYVDNSAAAGNKDYIVQAIYSDGEGEAVTDYLKGAFSTTFRVYDTSGNLITNNGINCQVTFNGKTQSTGFGSTTFNYVPFGTDKIWAASADGYPSTSGLVDVYKDNLFMIYLDGSSADVLSKESEKISIFPNPVKDFLYINISDINDNTTFQIIDINGKLIQKGSVNSREMSINTGNFKPGYYILKINNNNNILYTSFIKQ